MRTHCFISRTVEDVRGARWSWHTADAAGVSRKHSDALFVNFSECVDDARAHGFRHVEVPALDWTGEPVRKMAADTAAADIDTEDELDAQEEIEAQAAEAASEVGGYICPTVDPV